MRCRATLFLPAYDTMRIQQQHTETVGAMVQAKHTMSPPAMVQAKHTMSPPAVVQAKHTMSPPACTYNYSMPTVPARFFPLCHRRSTLRICCMQNVQDITSSGQTACCLATCCCCLQSANTSTAGSTNEEDCDPQAAEQ
jgi:hypothetical protein